MAQLAVSAAGSGLGSGSAGVRSATAELGCPMSTVFILAGGGSLPLQPGPARAAAQSGAACGFSSAGGPPVCAAVSPCPRHGPCCDVHSCKRRSLPTGLLSLGAGSPKEKPLCDSAASTVPYHLLPSRSVQAFLKGKIPQDALFLTNPCS